MTNEELLMGRLELLEKQNKYLQDKIQMMDEKASVFFENSGKFLSGLQQDVSLFSLIIEILIEDRVLDKEKIIKRFEEVHKGAKIEQPATLST